MKDATSDRRVVTVLKADISGSTALGARLDPEDLRAVLGSYFTALAREIHRRGGRVDKYVGDAVIAVFGAVQTWPDDAAQAVVAAVAMQEAIERENIALHERYGVQLACRIGIATGDVVVGAIAEDVQASDTVVGAPVALAEALESAAPLGSVLVSPKTRAAARGAIRFAPLERARPKGATATIPAYRVIGLRQATRELMNVAHAVETSASLQVMSERAHVLAEERKVVTVLFADISSSEPLGKRLAPSELRAVLGTYFGILARAIQHYGGTIDKYIGDAVMAVFGAPVSHEDDAARAIYAALAIQEAIARADEDIASRYGVRMSVRIGINTGEVVAGLLRGEVLAYTVTGDAVNTAQRIESVTRSGQILISEQTLLLARNRFEVEAQPPVTLKGKSEPVPVFRVVGRKETVAQAGITPFVGRSPELARLSGIALESLRGAGRIVHISGEAGVGKSRLVTEVLAGLPETALRLRSRCSSFEDRTPYAAVADIVRRTFLIQAGVEERVAARLLAEGLAPLALQTHDSAVALFLEVLGYGERSALGPDAKRSLLVTLLRTLLAARSGTGLILVVEDLHWIDAASAGTLGTVVLDVGRLPCFVMTTSREADVPWPAEQMGLRALDEGSAGAIVDNAVGTELDAKTRALILERAGGNPFFLEEVVHSIATHGAGSVPTTVQEVLEARLDDLEAEPRLVVQRAAVIGRIFWTGVLERVTPGIALAPALAALERQRFIAVRDTVPERTYTFSHALVQEVVYRTQLLSQRRTTHVQVGDAIGALYGGRLDEFVDVLAYHYRIGDDDAKARTALLRAGQRAQHLYARDEALDYFRSAEARSAADPAARATAEEGIGDVHRVAGEYVDALASYAKARDTLASDQPLQGARLLRKTGVIQHLRGETDGALNLFQDVLAQLPEGSERARALQNIGEVRWRQGRYSDAVENLLQATTEAERSGDTDALAEATKQLGSAYLLKGDLEESLRCYERSLRLYESLGDVLGQANALNNIGAARRRQTRHEEALAAYTRSLEIRQRIGDQLGIAHSRNNLGEIYFLRGALEQAETNFAAAAAIASAIGYIGLARVGLGATRVARGDRAQGREDLHEAVRELERAGNQTYLADALRDLAIAHLGDDDAKAMEWAQRAVHVASELGSSEKLGAALQVLGRVQAASGDGPAAITTLERSLDLLSGATERQELARTMAQLAKAYRGLPADDPRRDRADQFETQAQVIFSELGAELDLRRMDAR